MHAVLFVYQRAFTPELIIQRPVRIRVGTPEFLRIVLARPVVFFYRLLAKTPLPQPHVRSGRHYGNLLPSSPIAASILQKAGFKSKWICLTSCCSKFRRIPRSLATLKERIQDARLRSPLAAARPPPVKPINLSKTSLPSDTGSRAKI